VPRYGGRRAAKTLRSLLHHPGVRQDPGCDQGRTCWRSRSSSRCWFCNRIRSFASAQRAASVHGGSGGGGRGAQRCEPSADRYRSIAAVTSGHAGLQGGWRRLGAAAWRSRWVCRSHRGGEPR
jgi:hypothetical protein